MKVEVTGDVQSYVAEVPSIWEMIRGIRQGVGERLDGYDQDLKDGTVLVVSELAENLVKYVSGDKAGESSLTVNVADGKVRVQSQNAVTGEEHLKRVEWDSSRYPVRLYPFLFAGAVTEDRPIVIDARIAFGRPVVARKGISTWAIAERLDAGELVQDVAADYDLDPFEVEHAAIYERAA